MDRADGRDVDGFPVRTVPCRVEPDLVEGDLVLLGHPLGVVVHVAQELGGITATGLAANREDEGYSERPATSRRFRGVMEVLLGFWNE